ncbi:hypothetical protein ACFX11_034288 [Malus domestica]
MDRGDYALHKIVGLCTDAPAAGWDLVHRKYVGHRSPQVGRTGQPNMGFGFWCPEHPSVCWVASPDKKNGATAVGG